MTRLVGPPRLVLPTVEVRTSYLVGEQADCRCEGRPTDWLDAASVGFAGFVAARREVQPRWGVPSTLFWYVSGEYCLGALVVRHELTAELAEAGGRIGYHVVSPWRGQGHATRMLTAGLTECRRLERVLLTCEADNERSRRAILSNGGVPDGRRRGEDRFWIELDSDAAA
ncbi:hypothetical protein L3Q65_14675 [Amycolatopsis sp. FU40]|uniref:GNAT family N-acetyltransferase n=1 Tax=Amycolatopsis sp. FU40 TaxID=2914159 RepID=UPI001F1DFC3C|nr:GNAT family N-acetyltransferase [Amycolatopsis sp. FU40]UKD57916.1 hypothetical protein L3Q65_14675 [Amycolatopsis sp. FU40]